MILDKLYLSDDHYIIVYNNNNYLKIGLECNKIFFQDIKSICTDILREISDAFVLYQFPFVILKSNDQCIELNFSKYLNSKIIFFVDECSLICRIKMDNNIVREYFIKNYDSDIVKLYIKNVINIQKLAYIDDIEIYNLQEQGYPYVLIYLQKYKLKEIKKIARKYNWSISTQI